MESVVDPEQRKGTKHRITDFATACRDGSLFENVVAKYGITNKNFPHCNRELKLRPMTSYLRSIGWEAGSYDTAIGIRADELDRVNPRFRELRLSYPLVIWGVRRPEIISWWKQQPFDLEVPEHFGNCKWCWKKSLRKLLTIAKEAPEVFAVPAYLERTYPDAGPGTQDRPRRFFREDRSAEEILTLSKIPFEAFVDKNSLDISGSCSESCEVFGEQLSFNDLLALPA